MATTPPPLPSSSEDSDFDEDDFGCFKSSTPVVKAARDVKQNRKSDVQQNDDTIKKTDGTDSETLNRSEAVTNVHCIDQVSKPNEDPCTETPHIHSPQVNDITHTAASPQDLTMINASDKEEEENDKNSNFSYTDKSLSESAEDSQHLPNEQVLGKDEEDREVDHSTAVDEEGLVENVVEQTSVVTKDINSDRDTGCVDGDQNKNNEMEIQHSESPSLESTDEHAHTCEKGDKEGNEEDDLDDWSDMQEFHSGDSNVDDIKDAGIADQIDDGKSQSLCDHSIDSTNNSDDSESVDEDVNVKPEKIVSDSFPPCQDIPCETSDTSVPDQCPIPAEKDNEDEDFGAFDMDKDNTSNSNHKEVVSVSELSPQNDIPNIQSPNYEDDNAQAVPCDDQIEDDDDFGDFADFSSHQESENNVSKEEDVSPISFRASSTDQQVDKADDDNEGFDAFVMDSSKNNTDIKSSTDSEKVNINIAEEGHVAANDDDDDDDWGFKSADTGGGGQGNDDDDFGDFGDFGSADNKNDGDWASFNDTSAAADDDVDDFDDFSGSNFQTPLSTDTNSSMLKAQENSSKVEKVVFVCFPSVSSQPPAESPYEHDSDKSTSKPDVTSSEIEALCSVIEMGLQITPRAKEETWTIVKELRNKNPVVGTWGRLKDVNSSHALDHGWNTSHCCQEVFATLHIDTKNVLFSQKKQAVPFYASGLGILEPTRGAPNPAEKSQQPVQPNLLDTDKPDEHSKKVLDIPPVDFDWGSSGLTNPLKVFKAESFNTGMTSLDSFSDVLQKNLEPAKELSVEAKKILSKMSNLSFMRSKVLMFPIKD